MAQPHIQKLLTVIDHLSGVRVGVVGDLVADLYVSGKSDRVSREAPVLILQYEEEWLRPGGAANVATNVAALGATAHVLGIMGEDEIGRQLLNVMGAPAGPGQIHCDQVMAVPGRETITKTRFLAGAKLTSRQQVLRLDRQPTRAPDDAALRALEERIGRVDANVAAWIISDYGYGGFNAELRECFKKIARQKPVLADSRFGIHLFRGMTVIKPNEEEAEAAARALGIEINENALACTLAKKLESKAALVTLGNKGMMLGRDSELISIPAVGTEEIVDLTGAGDSVAATVASALAAGADVETACRLGNHSGALVVMKEGAATVTPGELKHSVETRENSAKG